MPGYAAAQGRRAARRHHGFRQEVRPFSDKQIALLQNFAAQAVIAMENARLITETREALEQQTATAEVLGVINSSPGDLTPVFEAMLEKAMRLCDAAYGTLATYDGERFAPQRCTACHSLKPSNCARAHAASPGTSTFGGHRATASVVVHFEDVATEDTAGAMIRGGTGADRARRRSDGVVPSHCARTTTLLGLIWRLSTGSPSIHREEIALLENFAAQAVIAMENARLITETREALEQQTATAEVLTGHQLLAR